MEYQVFRPDYCFYCTRLTLISKPIHFISVEEVKKLVCRTTLTHINKENPLFARESKGNPPTGLNFQHSSLTLTLTPNTNPSPNPNLYPSPNPNLYPSPNPNPGFFFP